MERCTGKSRPDDLAKPNGLADASSYLLGEKLSNSFDETLGLGSGSKDQPESSGSLAELDLTRLPDFYKAMGWQADVEATFFFESVRLEDLSLQELKVLYLLQLTEVQKMSDPIAILCQLESKWGEQ